MAGFDPEQDKKLKEWRSEETGLCMAICQYKDGEPKVQIGPRVITKKDGTAGAPRKAGRFTIEDVIWIYETIDEVKDELSDLVGPE